MDVHGGVCVSLRVSAFLCENLQLVQNATKDDNFAVIPGGRLVLDF